MSKSILLKFWKETVGSVLYTKHKNSRLRKKGNNICVVCVHYLAMSSSLGCKKLFFFLEVRAYPTTSFCVCWNGCCWISNDAVSSSSSSSPSPCGFMLSPSNLIPRSSNPPQENPKLRVTPKLRLNLAVSISPEARVPNINNR